MFGPALKPTDIALVIHNNSQCIAASLDRTVRIVFGICQYSIFEWRLSTLEEGRKGIVVLTCYYDKLRARLSDARKVSLQQVILPNTFRTPRAMQKKINVRFGPRLVCNLVL